MTFLVVACEASADQHGARVIEAVRALHPDARFVGIGGDQCGKAGVSLVAHARDLGFMGFTDVLFALPRVLGIMRRVFKVAREQHAQAALLIDAPDFNLRLAAKLHGAGIPVVYFISPKLWATRPRRSEIVRRFVKRMLVIFPFEVAHYRSLGVDAEYVGNPTVEQMAVRTTREQARQVLHIGPDERVVAMLPGSRHGEVTRIAPNMAHAARLLAARTKVRILVPCAPTIDREHLARIFGDAPVEIVDGRACEVLSAADVAVVAAGTATLEASLCNVSVVMVYRVSLLSWWIYRLLLRIRSISLINIIAGREVVTEFLQDAFTGPALASELQRLLQGAGRDEMLAAYEEIRATLGRHDTATRVATVLMQEAKL